MFDTTRMAVSGMALSFVAERTKNTWPGIIGHSFANMPLLLSIVKGVVRDLEVARKLDKNFCLAHLLSFGVSAADTLI